MTMNTGMTGSATDDPAGMTRLHVCPTRSVRAKIYRNTQRCHGTEFDVGTQQVGEERAR